MSRITVRVTQQFFDELDRLLPPARTPEGGPSATDFVVRDLPPLVERLADDYEMSTAATADPTVRTMLAVGALVPYITLYCELVGDVVEVFSLELPH